MNKIREIVVTVTYNELGIIVDTKATALVRCKDCEHRPRRTDEDTQGFSLVFPDYECPCQCDDGFYNWYPDDDWFCANAERKGK